MHNQTEYREVRETPLSSVSYREYMYKSERKVDTVIMSRKRSDEAIAEFNRKACEEEAREVTYVDIAQRINARSNVQNISKKREKMRKSKDKAEGGTKQNVIVQRTDGSLGTEAISPATACVEKIEPSQLSRMEMDDMSAYLGDSQVSKGDSGNGINRRNRKWKAVSVDHGTAIKVVGVAIC